MTERTGRNTQRTGAQPDRAASHWTRLRVTPAGVEDGIDLMTASDATGLSRWRVRSAPRETPAAAVLDHEARVAARLGPAIADMPERIVHDGRLLLLYPVAGELLPVCAGLSLPLARFLDLAVAAAALVGRLHGAGMVHGSLQPGHFVSATDGTLRLAGLGTAAAADLVPPGSGRLPASAALAYAAPEQARRQNPVRDARSDLYALGVVLYELLTGRLPLMAGSTAQWLHAHVAVTAAAPGTLRTDLPAMIDTILLRLIAKEPAERYQTAAALEADLIRCRDDWTATGTIAPFPPGRAELGGRAVLSGHLFGRAAELDGLAGAFARVQAAGMAEAVLVTGEAGAGKSALVNAFAARLGTEVCFAGAKSDLLLKEAPFAPFAQLLRVVIARLLSEPPAALEAARSRLMTALAGSGRLITDLVPEAAFVIGAAPALPEVPAPLSRMRLARVVVAALAAIARPGRPLVIFLDDLHWADAASLAGVGALLDAAPDHILFIAACREEELARRPDLGALFDAGRGRIPVTEIAVRPLDVADTAALVAAALSSTAEDVAPLAGTIHGETRGNAFYIGQVLRALVDGQVVAFSPASRSWTWDSARLGHPDTVVEFMLARLSALEAAPRELLRLLACAGGRSPVALIAPLAGLDAPALAAAERGLRDAGLLLRTGDTYRIAHDRVLEAAHALTPEAARGRDHARLARAMIGTGAVRPEQAFEIATQIARADWSDLDAAARRPFVEVLLQAARRGRSAGALRQAADYLALARRMTAPDWWARDPALMFDLELLNCDCLVGMAAIAAAGPALAALLPRAPDAMGKAEIHRLQAIACTVRSDYAGAIEAALAGLGLIGQDLPRTPSEADRDAAYARCRSRLAGRSPAQIAALPEMTDPALRQALALLSTLIASLFVTGSLRFVHAARIVELTLDHGTTPESAYGLAWFGVFAAHYYGAYDEGLGWGQAALEIARRDGYEGQLAASLIALDQVSPWTQPLRQALELAREAARVGRAAGDLGMACYARNHVASDLLVLGAALGPTRAEIADGLAFTREIGYRDIERILAAQLRLVDTLMSGDFRPGAPVPKAAIVSIPTLFFVHYYEGLTALLFGAWDEALASLDTAMALAWSAPAHIDTACCALFQALAAAHCARGAQIAETQRLLADHRARFVRWADLNPETFLGMRLLIEAEEARLAGDALAALGLYERAVQASEQAGFVHAQALVHELAGVHCLDCGLATAARGHLAAARACYLQWGAAGKVRQLQDRFPMLPDAGPPPGRAGSEDQARLDLAVVTRAAQALSEEILLDRVIDTLMTDMIVHAGAQYGLLLLMHGDAALIEARGRVERQDVVVQIASAVPVAAALPLSVLNRVIRTRKTLVFADAYAEAPELAGAGPSDRQVRSLICQPLIKRGTLVGVLYLENNLAAGVFTPDRTAMLEVLAPQAAISLDAARLYKTLVDENTGRARAELALRQARAELARTSQLTVMGGLAASIAHEINQPLAGIVSGAEAALRWLTRPRPDIAEAATALATVRAAGLRASGIVKSLRALARQSPAVTSLIVLEDVVADVLRLASTEIETQQVETVLRLGATRSAVMADPIQLQQVLFNLVANGIEAMSETPPARRRLTVDTRREAGIVEIGIADSGSGMAPEVRARIFEPLFTTKASGMGMGLAICRSIVAAHGGTLDATSAPGAGSRFFFRLATVT